jgi:hypothetical protein
MEVSMLDLLEHNTDTSEKLFNALYGHLKPSEAISILEREKIAAIEERAFKRLLEIEFDVIQ